MVDVSGIPNMGFGGGGYFGGSAALGYPAMSADQINASMGWNPNAAAFNPWANTPGGFGGQTDYYSALGAAYGRQTGGFGGGGYDPAAWATPSGAVEYGGGLPGIPYQDPFGGGGGGGVSQFDPFTGEFKGVSAGDTWSQGAPSSGSIGGWYDPYGGGGGYPQPQAAVPRQPQISQDWQTSFNNTVAGNAYNPYSMGDSSWYPSVRSYNDAAGLSPSTAQPGVPQFDPFTGEFKGMSFNPGSYAGDQSNYGIPYNGASLPGDIGFSRQSQMPNLGYNPGMSNWFANPGMSGGGFQSRFGMGFPNAGTPSQYAPGAAMPPGFSGAYSFDNQGGALPLGSDPDLFKIIPGGG